MLREKSGFSEAHESERPYLIARENYYLLFKDFLIENFPEDIDHSRAADDFKASFFNYEDAKVCGDLCESKGFNVEIFELAKGAPVKGSTKCFSVKLSPFMSKEEFENSQ